MNSKRTECLEHIIFKLSRTANWRQSLARKFPDDERNQPASTSLIALAAEATALPDDIWDALAPHYHWSNERFSEAISSTNRTVGFGHDVVGLQTYWRSLVANVRNAFEVN